MQTRTRLHHYMQLFINYSKHDDVRRIQTWVSTAFITRRSRRKASSIDSPPTRTPRFFRNTT